MQIESMYDSLKNDFSKLMKVLEEKESYVAGLEDKLREADYEVSCQSNVFFFFIFFFIMFLMLNLH